MDNRRLTWLRNFYQSVCWLSPRLQYNIQTSYMLYILILYNIMYSVLHCTHVTSLSAQLSLAIPPWVCAITNIGSYRSYGAKAQLVWVIGRCAVVCLLVAPRVQFFSSVSHFGPTFWPRTHAPELTRQEQLEKPPNFTQPLILRPSVLDLDLHFEIASATMHHWL